MSPSPRERIRTAALELFLEKGYAATATREICQRAKVTKPVLYYHFGSKERLYRELILEACGDFFRKLAAAAGSATDARQKLINVLTEDFAQTRRNPRLATLHFRLMFAGRREGPQIDYVELGMRWLKLLSGIIREGVRKGELKGDPSRMAEAVLGLHTIHTIGFLLRGKPALDRALARRTVDLICNGNFGLNTRRRRSV